MPNSRRYHRAHDTELRQWAEAGDLRAEFEQLHRAKIRHMVDDLASNPQTSNGPPSYVVPLNQNLGLHFQKGGTLVGLSLIINERTPKQAILDHWDEIGAWQERLRKWQGPWSSEERYITNIASWHGVWRSERTTAHPSYATLAQWQNSEIAVYLAEFVACLQLGYHPDPPPTLDCLLDQPSWSVPSDHWAAALFEAIRIMEAWGMSREAVRDYCRRAVATLTDAWTEVSQQGGPYLFDEWWEKLLDHVQTQDRQDSPIRRDQPIDRDRTIDKLKQWRRQRPLQ
jgi:hypothetical protein